MGKRKKRRAASGKHRNTLAKIFSIGGTVLLILVIVLCIPITVPRLFGYDIYTVISGSMEPAIPTGSLIYTKEIPPKEVKKEDVIAFYRGTDSGAIVTHRVVKTRLYPVNLSQKAMPMKRRILCLSIMTNYWAR